jgi:hypothetical protein
MKRTTVVPWIGVAVALVVGGTLLAQSPAPQTYGAHSDVERLSEAALYKFVEFTWNVVAAVAIQK